VSPTSSARRSAGGERAERLNERSGTRSFTSNASNPGPGDAEVRRHVLRPRGRREVRCGAEPAAQRPTDPRDRRCSRLRGSPAPSYAPSKPGRGRDAWAMARKAPRRQNLMVESALNALPRVRQTTTRGSSTTGTCRPRDGHRLGCRPGERSSQSVRTSRNTRCCASWSDVLLKIASAITLFVLTGDNSDCACEPQYGHRFTHPKPVSIDKQRDCLSVSCQSGNHLYKSDAI
jgi:hypothetical protein